MDIVTKYNHMLENKSAFVINNLKEMLSLAVIIEELHRSNISFDFVGINPDDYFNGKYTYPTLVWPEIDDRDHMFSHQTLTDVMDINKYEYLLKRAIPIDVFDNAEEYPEYFI